MQLAKNPYSLQRLMEFQIQYIIGHVLMSILILEAGDKQANTSELGDRKPVPSSRQLLQTSATLYHKGGLCLLLNGIGSACTYWVMHSLVAELLAILLPSSVAYIVASVLLAETHFFWTAYTILPRDQLRFVPKPRNYQRWKALMLPTLAYATAEMVMVHVPALLISGFTLPLDKEVTIAQLSHIVRSDILISGIMLSAQLFLLLPSYMVLILAHASLLPRTCETLIFTPLRQQQRGRRVGEVFSVVKQGPLQAWEAAQMIGVVQWLWCLELHGKMCLCLVGVTCLVHLATNSMM